MRSAELHAPEFGQREALSARRWWWLAIVWGVLVTAVLSPRLDRSFERVSPDGIAYISSAENLLAGRGLRHIAWDLSGPAEVPLAAWPPAYPLAIAGVSKLTGADTTWAAIWIARACWALFPVAGVMVFSRIGRPGIGMLCGAMVQLSPGAMFAPMALADAPFFVLAAASLACWGGVLKGTRRAVWWALGAGALAGLAYAFRNVGIALLVAMPVAGIAMGVLWRAWREMLVGVGAFVVGAAPFVVALKARALVVFGTLEPYTMPPSTSPLRTNISDAISAMVWNLTGCGPVFGRVVMSSISLVVVIVVPMVVVAAALMAMAVWARRTDRSRAGFVLTLIAYVGAGVGVVIAGRTVYEWGESVNPRYMFQYTWIIAGLLIVGVLDAAEAWRGGQLRIAARWVCGAAVMVAAPLYARVWVLPSERGREMCRVIADDALREAVAARAESHWVLSDYNWVVNQMGWRCAYHAKLGPTRDEGGEAWGVSRAADSVPMEKPRPILVVVLKRLTPDASRVISKARGDATVREVCETPTAVVFERVMK